VEEAYRRNFRGNRGERAKSARLALACLIVKEQLQLSDRDTVQMIRENPYIQYFLGYSEYQYDLSLDPSLLTHFRHRFPADVIAQVNQWIVEEARHSSDEDDRDDGEEAGSGSSGDQGSDNVAGESENRGTLILDATCAPQDIQYPTDIRLLHEARQKLEEMMDTLQSGCTQAKPRNYREKAKKDYHRFSRNRRPTKQQIRTALRKQLQYVARDLRLILAMQHDSAAMLSERQLRYLDTITRLYAQQKTMYESKTRRCDDRIVSLHQPYVRPIVRGKTNAVTEFGAKLTASVVGGYAEVTTLSWDAYNESRDLIKAAEQYRERHGFFPERILADKIFRTRQNLQYCKAHGIHLNGRPLGRPPKDKSLDDEQRRLEYEEAGERNAVEGKFGESKRRFSLGLVMTKLQATSETQIHLVFLVMNLQKILRDLFILFFSIWFFTKRRQIYSAFT
jgi:IS5 family transposase